MRWMVAATVVVVMMALANVGAGAAREKKGVNIAQQDWVMVQKLLPAVIVEDVLSTSRNGLATSICKEATDGLRAWLRRHRGEDFAKPQVVLLRENGYLKVVAFRFDRRKKRLVVPGGKILVCGEKDGEEFGKMLIRVDEHFPTFRIPLRTVGWNVDGVELTACLADNLIVRDRLWLKRERRRE